MGNAAQQPAPTANTMRHKLMALMEVGGASVSEIASTLGADVGAIEVVRKSPLYQAQLKELSERVNSERINSIQRLIELEARDTVRKMVELRDNFDGEVPHNVQLGAANALMDRIIEKKRSDPTIQDNRQVVVISDEAASRMASVLLEAGLVPADTQPSQITRTLESFIDEDGDGDH